MNATIKRALAKVKAAKLTDLEATSLANYLAQTVAVRVEAMEGLKDSEFFAAQGEIADCLKP